MGVKAIVLAAGRGTRLEEITQDKPKCLVELGGKSLIERQLSCLRSAGIGDIILVTGYHADMLGLAGTKQVQNPKWDQTNMVESLFCAESEFSDDIIITYADIVFEPKVITALCESPHEISIAINMNWQSLWKTRFADPLEDAESLRMDSQDRITDIGNPVENIDDIQGQYMGLMRFKAKGVAALKETYAALGSIPRAWMDNRAVKNAYMTDLLMELILTGHNLHAIRIDGGWLEIDTVEDYRLMQEMFKDGSIEKFYRPQIS